MDEAQYYEFLKAAAEQLTKTSSVEKPSAKESQKKTRYANKACVHCKSSHVACDSERPCKRCVRLNKEDSCTDAVRKKRGRPVADNKEPPKPPKSPAKAVVVHKPVTNNTPSQPMRPILPHIPQDPNQQARILNILQNNPGELSNLSNAEDFYNALHAISMLIPMVNGEEEPDYDLLNSIKHEGEDLPVQEHPGAVDPNFLKAIEQLNEYQSYPDSLYPHDKQ